MSDRKRGKAFKTILLESIRNNALIGCNDTTSTEDTELAYVSHVAERAFNSDDKDSGTLLKELLSKSFPGLKSTLPSVEFDLPKESTPIQKANAILDAVSNGAIPPDVGALLIQAAKYTIDIEMATELKDRMDKIEKELGLGG